MNCLRKVNEKYLALALLFLSFIILSILSFLSKGTYGGGDDIAHYQIARFAFKHPLNFLGHWGKPFYTLLISPFAQLGYIGYKLFNVLAGALSAFFCYRIARHYSISNSPLIIVFVLFTPVYTTMLLTGMTEVLFGLLLTVSVFLFLKEKFILSALVLSFLPFVRNEAIVIIPIFIFMYIVAKQYKAIPFVVTGYVIYSIIGFFVFDDINWLINRMPYGDASSIYGSGSLFHFVNKTKSINGIPLGLLFAIGILALFYSWIKDKLSFKKSSFQQLAIIVLPAIAYYAAHSYVWWRGQGGSLGLIRVMAAVTPLMAVVSLQGFNFVVSYVRKRQIIHNILLSIITLLVVVTPFLVYEIPVPDGYRERMMKETSNWFRSSEYSQNKVFFFDPLFTFYSDIDPFDKKKAEMLYWDNKSELIRTAKNEVVVWDAQFGPNEGRLPKQLLLNSPSVKLVKTFLPPSPIKVLGGHNYEIIVFASKKDSLTEENRLLYDKQIKEIDAQWEKELLGVISFDKNNIDSSGIHGYHINESMEYLLSQKFSYDDINTHDLVKIRSSVQVFLPSNDPTYNLVLSAALEANGKILKFWSTESKNQDFKPFEWNELKLEFTVPKVNENNAVVKVFLWNISRKEFYVNDYIVVKLCK
ncbi:MAG TPA: glycosyltransferase family 87 protein [Draconibacterium sp.]|nr:glycosyltransferase family 87 protein [Tenuifilaceae bacterium]HRX11061.1 glycosyltransferase family 87 protein [Draconibacterium sp.]